MTLAQINNTFELQVIGIESAHGRRALKRCKVKLAFGGSFDHKIHKSIAQIADPIKKENFVLRLQASLLEKRIDHIIENVKLLGVQ